MAEAKKTQKSTKRVPRTKVGKAAIAKAAKARAVAKKVPASRVTTKAQGFTDFIRKQGVVGLAVGLAIGTQAGATVKALVEGFINPLVSFIVGSDNGLLDAKWNIVGKDTDKAHYLFELGDRTLVFAWGSIFSSLITLLAVAAVIYFVVMGLKLDKLDKKKD